MRLINSPYKLLVVDVDGTLIGRDGTVSAENREALAKASNLGIQVSLSTGRVPQACQKIISQLSLDGYHIFFDGALVSTPNQIKEVYIQPIDRTVLERVVEFIRANDIFLEMYSASHYFVEQENWATEIHHDFFGLKPKLVDFDKVLKRETIIKVELMTRSAEEIAKARSFYLRFNGSLHFTWVRTPAYPGVDFINITDPRVSKGKALAILASHLGVSVSEVIAIGDGTNDIPVLSSAGLAIAMENAPAQVKAVADYITLDVDRNGLAAAINRFLL